MRKRLNIRDTAELLQAALRARGEHFKIVNGDPGHSVWLEGPPGKPLVMLADIDGEFDVTIRGCAPRPRGVGFTIDGDSIGRLADVIARDASPWDVAKGRRLEARAMQGDN